MNNTTVEREENRKR